MHENFIKSLIRKRRGKEGRKEELGEGRKGEEEGKKGGKEKKT